MITENWPTKAIFSKKKNNEIELVFETKQLQNKNIYKFSTKNQQQQQQHHSPSMNAILMECPITNANKKGNSILFQQNQNNDDVKNCNQNILVNIRLLPPKRNDKIDTYEKYILLDEIYDTEKKTKAKLLSPYLIEIIREEPVLMYPLEFIKSVEYQPFCKTNEMMAPPVYAKEIVAEVTAKDTNYNRQHSKQFNNQITLDDNPLTTKENRDRRKIPYSSHSSSIIELDPDILSEDNFELLHFKNEAYNKENAPELTENLNENYANDFKLLDDEEDVIQKDILQYIKLNLNENINDNGANLINQKNSNTVRKTTNNAKNNNNLYIPQQVKPINFIKHSKEILPNDNQASNKNVNDVVISNSVDHKNSNNIKQSNKNEYYNNNNAFEKLQDDEDDDDKETYYNFLLNTKEQNSKNTKLSHNNNNNNDVSIKQKQNNNSPAKNFQIMENLKKNNNINNNKFKENYIKPIRLYDDKPITLENLNALHGSQKFIPSTYNVMPISSNVTYPYESGGKPCDKHLPWNNFNNAKMQSTKSDGSITGSSSSSSITSSGSNNNNNNDNSIDIVPATNEQYNGIYFPSQLNSNSHTTDDDNTKEMIGEYFNAPINNEYNLNKNNNNRQLENAKNIKFKSNENYYPSHPIKFSVRANTFNDDKNINENLPQTISSHIKNSNIKNVNNNNNNDYNMKNNNKVVHQSENALNSKETELSKNNNFFIKEIYYDENPFSSSSSSSSSSGGGSNNNNNNNNNNNGVLKGHFQDDNINEMNDDDGAVVVVKSEDEFHKNNNNNNNNNKNYNNDKRNNLTNGKNKMNSVSVTGTTLSSPSSTNSLYYKNQNRVNGHQKDVDMMMMVQPPGVYYNDNLDSNINTSNDEYYIDEENVNNNNYNNNNQIKKNNNQPNIISSNRKLEHPFDNNNSNNHRIYRDENPQINDHNNNNNINNNKYNNNNNNGLNTNQLSMENGMKQASDEMSMINQKLNGFDNNEMKNVMNPNNYNNNNNNNNNENNNVDEENKMKNFNQNLNVIENVRKIPSTIETTKNSPENIKKLQNNIHQPHEKERDNDYENNLIIARNYLQSQQQLHNQINIHDYDNKKHKNNNDNSAVNDDADDDDYLLLDNDDIANDNNLQNDQIQYEEILKDKNLNTYDKMQLIEMVEPNKKSKLIKLKNSLSMMALEPLNTDVNDDGNDVADKHIGKRSKYEYDNYNDAGDYDDNRHIENEYYNDYSQITSIDKSMKNNLKYNNKMNEKNLNNNKNVPNKNGKSKLSNSKHKMKMISQDDNQRKNAIDAIWYSVYGISAPLQYLTSKIRIFRKHGNSWQKIAPPISLTSLSNNYVNKNLTISFSYHMNTILNPSSSTTTKQYYQHQNNNNNCKFPLVDPNRHKLLVPNDTNLLYSKDIITIDTEILPLNIIINNEYNKNLCDKICNEKYNQIENNNNINEGVGARSRSVNQKRENNDGICILRDLGYLPIKFNVMEKCRNNPDKLCLNMFNENSPVYRFSIKIPFIQNMLLYENVGRARITQIIVDGTVYGVLFITIQIMNVGYKLNEFSILIAKCPELCSTGKYMKIRNILPYQTITVNFDLHLELQESYGKREHNCEVQVQDKNVNNNKIIASRQFLIKPMARCFCLWNCLCNCISAVASTDIGKKSCRTMSLNDAQNAGFGKHQINSQKNVTFNWNALFFIISILICFVIVLGLLKAIIGCCVKSIGNWKYNHLQPYNTYDKASICKRFFINTIFFLVFPCVMLCKCFNPTDEDLLESHENVTWARSIIQKQINSDDYDTDDDYDNVADVADDDDEEDDDNDERKKFIKVTKNNNKFKSNKRLRAGAGGNINSNNSRNTNEEISENSFESYRNVEEEERDTSYVLAALTESRDSLKMLDGHYSEDSQLQNTDEKFIEATTLVKRLLAARMVYRTLNKPMGRVKVPENQLYSIRGYFIPAAGSGYQFITHIPLRQYWYIDSMNHSLKPIIPPLMLLSRDFIKNYANKQDVLNSGDLSEMPSMNTPCITVLVQDITLYNVNEDE